MDTTHTKELTPMTTAHLVDLMNELACLHQTSRAAVLTALREPTVDTVSRAIATSPDFVGAFIARMFDGGCPLLLEAPLWLHAYLATGGTLDDVMPSSGRYDANALLEQPDDAFEPRYLDTKDDLSAAADAGSRIAAALTPDARFEANVADQRKAFRVVRMKDGAPINVTRVMTRSECDAYLAAKGTPSMTIVEVP